MGYMIYQYQYTYIIYNIILNTASLHAQCSYSLKKNFQKQSSHYELCSVDIFSPRHPTFCTLWQLRWKCIMEMLTSCNTGSYRVIQSHTALRNPAVPTVSSQCLPTSSQVGKKSASIFPGGKSCRRQSSHSNHLGDMDINPFHTA